MNTTKKQRRRSARAERTVSPEREYRFDAPAEFPVFGRWIESPVSIAGAESTRPLAYWLAFHEGATDSDDALWARCVQANPSAFTTLYGMELFESSLDLPKGDVVFSSVASPNWIKDNPPGEILDRLAAVRNRYPQATIWLHEPVYQRPVGDEAPTLMNWKMLNDEAARAREAVWEVYRSMRQRDRVEYHLRRIWQLLQARWDRHQQHLSVSRKAHELRSSHILNEEREEVYDFVLEARSLGMHAEADYMFMAAYGKEGMSADALERAEDFRRARTGSFWSKVLHNMELLRHTQFGIGQTTVTALGLVAVPMTMAAVYALVPSVVLIDPVLTYTMPDDEGRHWFIGHWDWKVSPDGTKRLVCFAA